MLLEFVCINTKDVPWMTSELNSLITKRQRAFHLQGVDSIQLKFCRNAINCTRKRLKPSPPEFWRLCGFNSSSCHVRDHISIESEQSSLDRPCECQREDYRLTNPLAPLTLEDDSPEFLGISEHRVYKVLGKLNPAKACGPDAIPNWFLIEYTEPLAHSLP